MKTIISIIFTLFSVSMAVCQRSTGVNIKELEELRCYWSMLSEYKNHQIVIRTQTHYNQIFSGEDNLPEIDFDKYSLVGIYIGMGGCDTIKSEAFYYTENDKSFLDITIIQPDLCKRLNHITFWYIIPKLENEDDIKVTTKIRIMFKNEIQYEYEYNYNKNK
jgi:hypothetical protein